MANYSIKTMGDWPIDLWREVGRFLSCFEIGVLYFSGDRRITLALSHGAVQDLFLKYPSKVKQLGWVPMLKLFGNNLRSFSYDAGSVEGTVYHYPSKDDLRLLNSNLELVRILSDGGEHAFWSDTSGTSQLPPISVPLEDMTPIDIGKLWPKLHTLVLAQYGSSPIHDFGDAIQTLPPTLTCLTLHTIAWLGSRIEWLPPTLLKLTVKQCLIECDHLRILPRSLEQFHCKHIIAPVVFPEGPPKLSLDESGYLSMQDKSRFDISSLVDLPTGLVSLTFGFDNNTLPMEASRIILPLPNSLTRLKYISRMDFTWYELIASHLPRLVKLGMGSDSDFRTPLAELHQHHLKRIQKVRFRYSDYEWSEVDKVFRKVEEPQPSEKLAPAYVGLEHDFP